MGESTYQKLKFTHTANGRTWGLYGCAKRGCDKINLDYESFGAQDLFGSGEKSYCRNHIPLRSRIQLWWQERNG